MGSMVFILYPPSVPLTRQRLIATVIQRNMYPEIYTSKEISLIKSLMNKFREIIADDEALYGFSLEEFDVVMNAFPDVDLIDEEPTGIDHSWIVLNNMYSFLLDDNPNKILKTEERELVKAMWGKLKNV